MSEGLLDNCAECPHVISDRSYISVSIMRGKMENVFLLSSR